MQVCAGQCAMVGGPYIVVGEHCRVADQRCTAIDALVRLNAGRRQIVVVGQSVVAVRCTTSGVSVEAVRTHLQVTTASRQSLDVVRPVNGL